MYRKYRRNPVDFEVLMAVQEIAEITESMGLLDSEIVEEIFVTMEKTEVCVHTAVHLLKARNPELDDIAIMSSSDGRNIVLLYKDKHGVIVSRRRTKQSMIRHILRISA